MTKVALGPFAIASGPWYIRNGLRANGVHADVVLAQPHPFGYPQDVIFTSTEDVVKTALDYDAFHSFFGVGLVDESVPTIKALGKKTIMTFNGCDVRTPGKMNSQKLHTTVCSHCDEIYYCNQDAKHNNMMKILDTYDEVMCDLGIWDVVPPIAEKQGRTLVPYPQPIDLSDYPVRQGYIPHAGTENDPWIVAHAPSQRSKKGTSFVIRAIENLRAKGVNITVKLLNGSHEQVRQGLLTSDIAVDQLLIGWYGTFALEAMAFGVPTLCYLRSLDARGRAGVPEPCLMNTSIDKLEEDIMLMINDSNMRATVAKEQRTHVEEFHDVVKLCKKWLPLYGVTSETSMAEPAIV